MLMVCSTAAPTAPPHNITTLSTISRSVSVSWTEIRCIEQNGPITNYTVEFQEVGGALRACPLLEVGYLVQYCPNMGGLVECSTLY